MSDKNATRRLYVTSEMIAAGRWPVHQDRDMLDELMFSYGPEGDCEFEFSVELIRLDNHKGAMRLKVFDDSFRCFSETPEVFRILGDFNKQSGVDSVPYWESLIKALQGVGWVRIKPEPKPKPAACPTCGKE